MEGAPQVDVLALSGSWCLTTSIQQRPTSATPRPDMAHRPLHWHVRITWFGIHLYRARYSVLHREPQLKISDDDPDCSDMDQAVRELPGSLDLRMRHTRYLAGGMLG